jgi:ATP-binding cassette subfamily F protein 3
VREENRRFLIKQFKEQEKKKEQLQIFVARFHAQPNKAAAVRAKRRVLERIEEQAIVLPPDPKESIRAFHFPAAAPSGHLVMKLEGVSKAYADTQVYKDFDFEVVQGERAVLAGENGAGKSTLLKILAGVVDIDSGVRTVGYRAGIGYFSQARLDVLNPDNTVLREAYSAALGYTSETVIRTVLGAFLFTGDDVDKKVGVLSGGEKSRLILAKLLINPPNFLLLDEPTTHLDVDAVDALVKALTEYEGTIVFISHDIHFVRSVANVVFEVKNGRVRKFSGNFDYYLQKREQPEVYIEPARARVKAKEPVPDKKQEERAARENMLKDREEKRRVFNEAIQKKIDKLKKEKDRLHLERYAKTRALANQHIYRDEETIEKYKARLKYVEERTRQINDATKLLKKSLK